MSPTTVSSAAPALDLQSLRREADRWMLAALALAALMAVALGAWLGQASLALAGAATVFLPGVALYALARGSLLARCGYPVLLMAAVALHIQLGAGRVEFHFGVFVSLAFLLLYRDWLPLVVGAVTIAVHHLAFDRLQALGFPVYCMTQPDFALVWLHAGYVIVQTGFEIVIGLRMRRDAVQAHELHQLVGRLQQGERLALDAHAGASASSAAAVLLQGALGRIAQAIGDVDRASNAIGTAAVQIAGGQGDLAQRTEQAASSLQQTVSSVQQITESVRHNASSAQQANQLAGSAAQAATRGGEVVAQVVGHMNDIASSSRQIAEITGVIDGIAFQTNILALNAAVEAARAGEHGRGFAVVAGEVRQLAQRSAQAAREIKALIQASVQRISDGAQLVEVAGSSMGEIEAAIGRVTTLIAELSTSAGEQSQRIAEINTAIARLDQMTQGNAALVQQSSAASMSLREQAQRLVEVVNVFSLRRVAA
ncbi:methyl-accepting chemotaxis protein [Methylibium rhizosphaerae]|uniref:methyl-accepting chemotaxis protein n=1 Tax=Methylibium rhizosphaerae TaxID=2570323 RepID=UPI0011267AA3|nr:methyl-accepting chemotaxis protein [Methylibium rhizosphaerae]